MPPPPGVVATGIGVVVVGETGPGGTGPGGTATGPVLAMKLFVIVAVHVSVLAPAGAEPLHWLMVVGRPVVWVGGAVTVQVIVPPGPPELLHWVTLWPPGPAVPGRSLPGGVATHVSVPTVPGFWHCRTVESLAAPVG
jgi:hypothetical protein